MVEALEWLDDEHPVISSQGPRVLKVSVTKHAPGAARIMAQVGGQWVYHEVGVAGLFGGRLRQVQM